MSYLVLLYTFGFIVTYICALKMFKNSELPRVYLWLKNEFICAIVWPFLAILGFIQYVKGRYV